MVGHAFLISFSPLHLCGCECGLEKCDNRLKGGGEGRGKREDWSFFVSHHYLISFFLHFTFFFFILIAYVSSVMNVLRYR